jgi:hypothetical protein
VKRNAIIKKMSLKTRSRKARERVQGRHVGDTYLLPESLSPFGRIKKGGF